MSDIENQVNEKMLLTALKILDIEGLGQKYKKCLKDCIDIDEINLVDYIKFYKNGIESREKKYQNHVETYAKNILSKYKHKEEDFDAHTAINEIFNLLTDYGYAYENNDFDMLAFVENFEGSCYHVATFVHDLLDHFKIDNEVMKARLGNVSHAWNKVCNHECDLTWALQSDGADVSYLWMTPEEMFSAHIYED